MKLYKAFVSLDYQKGWKYRFEEAEVEETNKSYIGNGKRIDKKKLLVPDTLLLSSFYLYHYFTYCLHEQKQEALDMLKAKILKEVEVNKVKFDKIYAHAVSKSENALGDIIAFTKMLRENDIKCDINHDLGLMKNFITVYNFYKSDKVELYEENNSFIAYSRYETITPINSIKDLAELNYKWWQASKDKLEDWAEPAPEWKKLFDKYKIE